VAPCSSLSTYPPSDSWKAPPERRVAEGTGEPLHYTVAEVARLVQYAEERGITVVPEIDIPGTFILHIPSPQRSFSFGALRQYRTPLLVGTISFTCSSHEVAHEVAILPAQAGSLPPGACQCPFLCNCVCTVWALVCRGSGGVGAGAPGPETAQPGVSEPPGHFSREYLPDPGRSAQGAQTPLPGPVIHLGGLLLLGPLAENERERRGV